jgi:hypothetical protein
MPNPEQKKESISAAPSQNFLQRIFGSSPITPEIEQGLAIARKEMPDLANVEMYGPLSRLLLSGAKGYASPAGTIYLNPAQLAGHSSEDVADTLTHEQEHVNQIKSRGGNPLTEAFRNSIIGRAFNQGYEPYHRSPDEMQAFRAEDKRRRNMNRGGTTAIPSFETGEYYAPRDIRLRPPEQQQSIAERQRKLLGGGR